MLAPILGAVGSLASTILGKSSADKANATAQANALRQEQLQKEFAQNGIQWKVADAKAAGIHPLYALGAQTTSFSPVSVGSTQPDWSGLANAGQNIGRAIDSTRTGEQKIAALQRSLVEAQVTGAHLDNDIKRAQLASSVATNSTPTKFPPLGPPPPGIAIEGQGQWPTVEGPNVKLETDRDAGTPGDPGHVPGQSPGIIWYRNAQGGLSATLAPKLAESFDSDITGQIEWAIRNRLLPLLSDKYWFNPPEHLKRPGDVWEWSWEKGYYPYDKRSMYNAKPPE